MKLLQESLYHIYNRGNNQQRIFLEEKNYDFFLRKAHNELEGQLDFLTYCLMPNHFHFLVYILAQFKNKKNLPDLYSSRIPKLKSLLQMNTRLRVFITSIKIHFGPV